LEEFSNRSPEGVENALKRIGLESMKGDLMENLTFILREDRLHKIHDSSIAGRL